MRSNSLFSELSGIFSQEHVPPYDISQEGGGIVLSMDMPGAKKEDIQVEAKSGYLFIKASKPGAAHSGNGNRWYGDYSATFQMAESVDTGSIKAAYTDGVLKLTIERKEGSGPKKISVA